MSAASTVLMAFPAQLGGGDPATLLADVGLSAVQVSPDTWKVGAQPAGLVHSRTLATPWNPDRKFDLLEMYPTGLPPELADKNHKTAELLLARASEGNLTAILNMIQVEAACVDDTQIAALADHYDREIGKYSDDGGPPHFPNHTTHVITFSELIYKRSKLFQILIRLDQDPQLATDFASQAFGDLPLGELFNSNDALLYSLRVFDMYVAPLLGCRTPFVWAVNGQRLFGSIIFSLGQDIPGIESTPAELLQLLPHTLGDTSPPSPFAALSRHSRPQAIDWWAMRLNQMFQYLTGPTNFADFNDEYQPYLHQNWMMTIDQPFRRIASINLSYRDPNSQLVLMFSVMDLIGDRITDEGQKLYRPTRAEQALEVARAGIPPRAAELLLPKAEHAVEALRRVQDGFFIKAQRGYTTVKLVNNHGDVEHWDMETATRKMLRARRNAVHGFGGLDNTAGDAVRILAQHDGDLPQELANLPYLYLLEFLCKPEEMAAAIRNRAHGWNKPTAA